MSKADAQLVPSVMVFSDLDGSLLDHETYSFAAAQPALQALAARHIPVVPVSSKTLAELIPLMQELGLSGAAIAENGAVMRHPDGTIDCPCGVETVHEALQALPKQLRAAILCFNDMDVSEIEKHTGLSADAAARAKQRQASEPFIWRGTDKVPPPALAAHLKAHGLALTQGGRFFHIVPPRDKAAAMQQMLESFAMRPKSWALGDGPNDAAMLLAADRGALIANPHSDAALTLPSPHHLYVTAKIGPSGWREAIDVFLAEEFG